MSIRAPILVSLILAALAAQADIYKYTDENGVVNYTNMPSRLPSKAERIAREPGASSAVAPAAADGTARTTTPTPAGFPRVDGSTQRKRDDTRRQILAGEVQNEQKALEEAKQALVAGQEVRNGNERNYQKYLDRVKALQDAVDAHQANLDALEKEISSLH
jgi:hypothetical protein